MAKHYRELDEPPLSLDEQKMAHDLWIALLFSETVGELREAQQTLKLAPLNIQQAITAAIVFVMAQHQTSSTYKNFFADEES